MAKLDLEATTGQVWTACKGFLAKWWRWAVLIFVLIVALLALILAGYWAPWTGFGAYTTPEGEWQREKTLWDWLDLLLVPMVLALGAWLLNRSARNRQQGIEKIRIKEQQKIEIGRSRETALQTFLDRMTELIDNGLRESEVGDAKRAVARARTLTVLQQLDGERKGLLLLFLRESDLIGKDAIVDLHGADLRGADLTEANLSGANLSGAYLTEAVLFRANLRGAYLSETGLRRADLSGADLHGAYLYGASLYGAKLGGADLTEAVLFRANLSGADLRGADVRRADLTEAFLGQANLSGANLSGADLRGAYLDGAGLGGAGLPGANLVGAIVTSVQLNQATTLEGATLPDGTKYAGESDHA
ncbi:MAG: pentapeptide repeat-containing protein [Anaerolineae bacterium]|jgi:uncharacterized protein YjbI with pentapeptide repeats/membrane protein implicated in regulation of membrane protease activity